MNISPCEHVHAVGKGRLCTKCGNNVADIGEIMKNGYVNVVSQHLNQRTFKIPVEPIITEFYHTAKSTDDMAESIKRLNEQIANSFSHILKRSV